MNEALPEISGSVSFFADCTRAEAQQAEAGGLYSQKVKNKLLPTALNRFHRSAGFAISAGVCVLVLSTFALAQTGTSGSTSAATVTPSSSLALVPMPREIHPRADLSLKDGISVETTSHDPED
jgi:hypothetical protein